MRKIASHLRKPVSSDRSVSFPLFFFLYFLLMVLLMGSNVLIVPVLRTAGEYANQTLTLPHLKLSLTLFLYGLAGILLVLEQKLFARISRAGIIPRLLSTLFLLIWTAISCYQLKFEPLHFLCSAYFLALCAGMGIAKLKAHSQKVPG